MNILGLNGLGVMPSASIIINGNLVVFAEEERFTRLKGSFGFMPSKATRFCLAHTGLTLADIDCIAFGWDCNLYKYKLPIFLFFKYLIRAPKLQNATNLTTFIAELIKYNPGSVKQKIFEMFRSVGLKGNIPPVKFVSHHLSHAATSYYLSGFKESYILIIDGSGEAKCTSLYKAKNEDIKFIKSINVPDSLGWFYQSFTEFLGFNPNHQEGKLMALAAYGKYDHNIAKKVDILLKNTSGGNYRYEAMYSFLGKHFQGRVFSEEFVSLFGASRAANEPITTYHKDLAFAVQQKLETTVVHIVKDIIQRKDFNGNLCLGGGVGLNCKMNGVLTALPEIKNLYVPAMTNDAGTAVGAALVLAKKQGCEVAQKMEHSCWGSEYNDEQIEKILLKCKANYSKPEILIEKTASLLAQEKVIGWFQGRMEGGPRALGGRSILASPLDKKMQDIVNLKVKNREHWRPFAASILDEAKTQFVYLEQEAPFMTIAFKVNPAAASKIPAAIHIDNTTRPQFVKKTVNSKYWELINCFGKITGVPALLNTSFNTNEEPLVENPEQALKAFYGSGLDYLVIGSFLVKK